MERTEDGKSRMTASAIYVTQGQSILNGIYDLQQSPSQSDTVNSDIYNT